MLAKEWSRGVAFVRPQAEVWGGGVGMTRTETRVYSVIRHSLLNGPLCVPALICSKFQASQIPNLVKCSYVLIHISDVYNSTQHQENEWLGFKPWGPDYINTPYTYTR